MIKPLRHPHSSHTISTTPTSCRGGGSHTHRQHLWNRSTVFKVDRCYFPAKKSTLREQLFQTWETEKVRRKWNTGKANEHFLCTCNQYDSVFHYTSFAGTYVFTHYILRSVDSLRGTSWNVRSIKGSQHSPSQMSENKILTWACDIGELLTLGGHVWSHGR